jgi:hypothetical protein
MGAATAMEMGFLILRLLPVNVVCHVCKALRSGSGDVFNAGWINPCTLICDEVLGVSGISNLRWW